MKQVFLLYLFLQAIAMLQAQKNSPRTQFSSATITEIKIPVAGSTAAPVRRVTEIREAAYYIGEKYKGTWTSRFSNGNPCDSGYLSGNMPDGIWKSWYPNGKLRMKIDCNARRLATARDEMQRLYRPGFSPAPDQQKMKQLVANTANTYDKLIYRTLYIAIHPPDMEFNSREVQVRVQMGDSTQSFTTLSQPYTEALVHGDYTTWYANGALKDSGYCNDGIRNGVWQEWDESGNTRAIGFYKNGLRWKDWRYYNKGGKLLFVKKYNRSEEVTETIVLK